MYDVSGSIMTEKARKILIHYRQFIDGFLT
jgi:hypothetical protein